ncbi:MULTISPECIES: response regulator [Brevibacillus]|uniref:response regulator n=1 Tax=Brevibacillus TaxID=55080 RepID=UPI00203DC4F8|nr:response regulator [Brevibacillus borstelensis]MCM3622193.1 response regulator [Brevibacillus borstelensis]MED1853329.1 response regulator [Brevibacillus borstelensis]
MRYFITDDDQAVRSMLAHIIEDADLGIIAGEAEDGSQIDGDFLRLKQVDILLIDLLMPNRDGIETIRQLIGFEGRIVMISQIESKEMIAEAYSLGIEYYITKPINRLEVLSVLQKVQERILLQRSIEGIQRSLSVLQGGAAREPREQPFTEKTIQTPGKFLLTELGMIGESGSKDLLEMLDYLHRQEGMQTGVYKFPALKEIFLAVAQKKLGDQASGYELQKEVKAAEQRVRRAIYQALSHLASLGLTDYANPKFETYASTFFDFTEVRKRMRELENQIEPGPSSTKINTKKFMLVLYLEAKRLLG